jgi:hypothetical protein
LLAVGLILAALLASPYIRYRRSAGLVPPWVRFGGLQAGGSTADEVAAAIGRQADEPISALYGDRRILLRPKAIGFTLHDSAMLTEAMAYDTPGRLLRFLVADSLGRPTPVIDLPVRFSVDEAALDRWLDELAAEYDREPIPPQPIVQSMNLAPGKPGMALDKDGARRVVIEALASPAIREVRFPISETPAPPLDLKALQSLLQARIEAFPGIGSVYLHHLPTGGEALVNPDVAYAGTSTLKIAILAQIYRLLDAPPGVETSKLISETMGLSGNFTANLLLGKLGDGDWDRGVEKMNRAFQELGLKNSFMAVPYDRKLSVAPRIVTEANSRTDLNTQPDPYMQTTARDIGSMLQMLAACVQGGGTLIALYGDRVTPGECRQALDFMALNQMSELIVGGLPAGARAVHKHGYVPDTHGDVSLIWGPQGPYVLSIWLYRPTWLEWHISNPTMKEISSTVWDYFDGKLGKPREEHDAGTSPDRPEATPEPAPTP